MNFKKNCMSYWFPKLAKTGIPFPQTAIVDMNKIDDNFNKAMMKLFWMKKLDEKDMRTFSSFRGLLEHMITRMGGYPVFIRTGQTSHKHQWSETCYVKQKDTLMKNVQTMLEYSIMSSVNPKKSFPINVWVVRKLIPTSPIFSAFGSQIPITKEMRFFIRDGKIECMHPYWPEESIKGFTEDKDWKKKLKTMNIISDDDLNHLKKLTLKVARVFKGYWSIDWLKSKSGKWYAIDMATGKDSYHWKGCTKGKVLGDK